MNQVLAFLFCGVFVVLVLTFFRRTRIIIARKVLAPRHISLRRARWVLSGSALLLFLLVGRTAPPDQPSKPIEPQAAPSQSPEERAPEKAALPGSNDWLLEHPPPPPPPVDTAQCLREWSPIYRGLIQKRDQGGGTQAGARSAALETYLGGGWSYDHFQGILDAIENVYGDRHLTQNDLQEFIPTTLGCLKPLADDQQSKPTSPLVPLCLRQVVPGLNHLLTLRGQGASREGLKNYTRNILLPPNVPDHDE
jgi:hypothetical protein